MSSAASLPPARYEPSDGSPRVVVLTSIGLALGIGAALLAAGLLYAARYQGLPATREAGPESSFRHGPDERTDIARDWAAQDEAVHQHLATYGWVDRPGGIVRIPIERAMDLIAAEAGKEDQ